MGAFELLSFAHHYAEKFYSAHFMMRRGWIPSIINWRLILARELPLGIDLSSRVCTPWV